MNKNMEKINVKKNDKYERLLNSAYNLFLKKGFKDTTISDIVNEADVAKGTFYLYFKDKYDIQEQLTVKLSSDLFQQAISSLMNKNIEKFEDRIIYIVDYIIDILIKNPDLIKFISKDLSLGYYNDKLSNFMKDDVIGLRDVFIKGLNENNIKLKNPDVTLYMIIELVSATCFSSITKEIPLPIDKFKPYLHNAIISLINERKSP